MYTEVRDNHSEVILTHQQSKLSSYRNPSADLRCISIVWFLMMTTEAFDEMKKVAMKNLTNFLLPHSQLSYEWDPQKYQKIL